jgi:pimeloyl-ACP methyl ester carboxylesterase
MLPIALLFSLISPIGEPDDEVSHGLPTPPAVLEQIVDMGMNDSHVMQTLKEVVEGIGPRLTGSTNLNAAGQWAVEAFTALGLEVELEQWGEVPVGFDRGPSSGALVTPEHMELTFMTRAWSAGTDGPVRAHAVLAPRNQTELDAKQSQLAGAWVLTPSDWPARPRGNNIPEGLQDNEEERAQWIRTAMSEHQTFTQARSEAYEAAGIAGVISPSRRGDRLIMNGNMNIQWDDLPTNVRITMVSSQFEALRTRLDAGEALELEFNIENRFVKGPIPQYNVVADLIGDVHPEEYVIVGGHLDSWDIAPGATDNGTGVATTLEAARLLVESGARPGRTIRFMLWGGEEQGLLGSRAWVADHLDAMEHISAVLVHDGGTNALSGLQITRSMQEQMKQALAPVLRFSEEESGAQPFSLELVAGLSTGGSDHNSYLAQGVPGFFWKQSGSADYEHTHHTQHDHYAAAIPEYQRHSAVVVALSALGLADLPEKLSRRGLVKQRRTLGVFLDGNTVTRVSPRSQAEALGLEAGDVFVRVNGKSLDEPEANGNTRSITAVRDQGEGRKLIAWQRGDEILTGVFEWDAGDIDRDPETLEVTTADGVSVHADYYMGASDGPAAGSALILLHMNRSDRHSWLPVRDELYAAGIATVAVDMRGHGESVDAEGVLAARLASGDTALYEGMVQDVEAIITWLEARGYSAERIGLLGASVGCSVALRAAVADPRLAGVMALTPGLNYLGLDSLVDVAAWDDRPLVMVSSLAEAPAGAEPLYASLRASNPWTRAQLVLFEASSIHGTRMFGSVESVEEQLARWWSQTLSP